MPLHECCYLSATDKIYGVMSNYILKFNATTGLKEASAKVCAPCYGPMRIVGKDSTLYVASANDYSVNSWNDTPLVLSNRDIWSVDATTLVATNPLGVGAKESVFLNAPTFNERFASGPRAMLMEGDYIYYQYTYPRLVFHHRINSTNSADYKINYGPQGEYDKGELFTINGAALYNPSGFEYDTEWYNSNLNSALRLGSVDVNPRHPVCSVYASGVGNVYSLCGNEDLVKCLDFTTGTKTILNLGLVFANVTPMRMRLHPNGQDLYIPCQNQDVVIIWNTLTDTGTYKDGFSSPIDVVFTGSKIWAVQSGIQSLKEIV